MKKILFLLVALTGLAFGADGEQIKAFSVVAAGIGLGVAALGGAIGMGHTAAATILGTARNPGLAMIEAQVIYALVIALIALYANPFLV